MVPSEWRRHEYGPEAHTWAMIWSSTRPSVGEHDPASFVWRKWTVEPGLCGLRPRHSQTSRIEISGLGQTAQWQLPLERVLGVPLAWHPSEPLVAGLAMAGRHASPWVANFNTRKVTQFDSVRAATSLTSQADNAGQALAWGADLRLAILIPAHRDSEPSTAPWSPQVYRARGPGLVEFCCSASELGEQTTACPAVLDIATGEITQKGRPAMIRSLSTTTDGNLLLLEIVQLELGQRDNSEFKYVSQVLNGALVTCGEIATSGARWSGGSNKVAWRDQDQHLFGFGNTNATECEWLAHMLDPACQWWPAETIDGPGIVINGASGPELITQAAQLSLGERGNAGFLYRQIPSARGLLMEGRRASGELFLLSVDPTTFQVAIWRAPVQATPPNTPEPPDGTTWISRSDTNAEGTARLSTYIGSKAIGCALPTILWLNSHEATEGDFPRLPPSSPPELLQGADLNFSVLDFSLRWPSHTTAAFVEAQMRSVARFALEDLAKENPGPVVVAGHSFDATLALYCAAYIRDFAGAIAISGCYDRMHTPSGWHWERRSYWNAGELYRTFSAVHFADRLRTPVLIVHGAEDVNMATPVEQSIHLYRTIVAAGGSARLMLLPYEGHNLRYAESLRAVTDQFASWLCEDVLA